MTHTAAKFAKNIESLYAYRRQFPWCQPHVIVVDVKTSEKLELISWPWDENGVDYVNARKPNDPFSVARRLVSELRYEVEQKV